MHVSKCRKVALHITIESLEAHDGRRAAIGDMLYFTKPHIVYRDCGGDSSVVPRTRFTFVVPAGKRGVRPESEG
jgi:hypothetical protein